MKYLLIALGSLFLVVPETEYKQEGTIIDQSTDASYLEDRATSLRLHRDETDSIDGYYSDSEIEFCYLHEYENYL